MNPEVDLIKQEFAKRLHQAMDNAGFEMRGRARILSKEFKVSDKGAGKWLNGEAIPETSKIPLLANFLNISAEWLLTGNDEAQSENSKLNKINNIEKRRSEALNSIISDLETLENTGKLTSDFIKIIQNILTIASK